MGYGGDLIISAAAREICQYYGKKILPVRYNSRFDKLIGRKTLAWSAVFDNNVYFSKTKSQNSIVLNRSLAGISYVERELGDRFIFKKDIHAVEVICNHFGVSAKNIEPEIFFLSEEYQWFDLYKKSLPSEYVVIEPYSKDDHTPNRAWNLEKWQEVVNEISQYIAVVQLGSSDSNPLNNVIPVFDVSFRQAGLILSEASLFMSTIGGLMHLAKAVKTPSIVLHSGYEPLHMASYPSNLNLFTDVECSPCGLRTLCKCGVKCINHISSEVVIANAKRILAYED